MLDGRPKFCPHSGHCTGCPCLCVSSFSHVPQLSLQAGDRLFRMTKLEIVVSLLLHLVLGISQLSLQAGDRVFRMTKLRTEILVCLCGPVDDVHNRRLQIVEPVMYSVGKRVQ